MDTTALPYAPKMLGHVYGMSRVSVFGMAYDHEQTLIALSVQGPQTSIEQVHYKVQGQEDRFYVTLESTEDGDRYDSSRSAYPRKSHYRIIKTAIPDTSDVSMIMLNDTLFAPVRGTSWTHVFMHDAEAFKREVFLRVKNICYFPVLEAWKDYLTMYGMSAEFMGQPLCGKLIGHGEKKDTYGYNAPWMSAGFSIGYIRNEREPWEKLISEGLSKGLISI